MPLSRAQREALDRSVSVPRMGTYLRASGHDPDLARARYLWDRDLAVAFFADIALLEVALRNAMHERLTGRWGERWYERGDVPLDDRSAAQLAEAYGRVVGPKLPGRVVAQCTFGFWAGLLDRGAHAGRDPRRVRCDYDLVLWRGVLDRGFPGGRAVARADGERWGRVYAHQVVTRVNALRNRVAHHEPLVDGYPLPGQRGPDGRERRRSAVEGFADLMRLAGMIDRDLRALLLSTSAVPGTLGRRPRPRDLRRPVPPGPSRPRRPRP